MWGIWCCVPMLITVQFIVNKAIRDGRPRPPRHQCVYQISSWSVEKWLNYDVGYTATAKNGILTPIPNLYDHSFPRYGQITFLTFRRPTTLTFDLQFWKYLSVTVYPYVICMPSFIMIGWEMAEILHFEIVRKHGQTNKQTHTHKQTHTQTNTQTWALQYLALPLWGRGNKGAHTWAEQFEENKHNKTYLQGNTINVMYWGGYDTSWRVIQFWFLWSS